MARPRPPALAGLLVLQPGAVTGPPRLWLARHVSDDLAGRAQRLFPLETGGILLGYVAPARSSDGASDVVVVDAIGPGPRAKHDRRWFVPDHEWQVAELAERYKRSGRIAGYVGDWHSHPDGTALPSRQRLRTMRRIARHAEARLDRPTMLIVSMARRAGADGSGLRAWRWAPRPLFGRIRWPAIAAAAELNIVDVEHAL
jgi:integrative and conjugative element protein (TIGR02256 family)